MVKLQVYHQTRRKLGKVIIGSNCFLGVRILTLPNVTIGYNVIMGQVLL